MNEWIRHGDVILQQVEKTRGTTTNKQNIILAWGETTGHKHTLTGQILESQLEDQRFVELKQEGTLTHEEHETLTVPKGKYQVFVQREVDLLGEVRQVMD